ncbi:MAG: hypothetical protein AB7I38_12015 [Dehalococcoidia bacterium]
MSAGENPPPATGAAARPDDAPTRLTSRRRAPCWPAWSRARCRTPRARAHLRGGRVYVDGAPVTDPSTPAPWPAPVLRP